MESYKQTNLNINCDSSTEDIRNDRWNKWNQVIIQSCYCQGKKGENRDKTSLRGVCQLIDWHADNNPLLAQFTSCFIFRQWCFSSCVCVSTLHYTTVVPRASLLKETHDSHRLHDVKREIWVMFQSSDTKKHWNSHTTWCFYDTNQKWYQPQSTKCFMNTLLYINCPFSPISPHTYNTTFILIIHVN